MFLITNGDLNITTKAVICDNKTDLETAIRTFMRDTGTEYDQVIINPIGEAIGHAENICTKKLDCQCEQCLLDDEENRDMNDHIFGEEMDGDHDSAMASAGFGTDEDYGHFGGDFYD